jgi:hypothetical protein
MPKILSCVITLPFALTALAQTPPKDAAAGDQEMHAQGPMSRIPKNEKADKAQLEAFFTSWGDTWKKGDLDALASMVDFPVLMLTDDSKGSFSKTEMSQDQWVATMKPMIAKMEEKRSEHPGASKKWSHKQTCFILSDDLASCESEGSMSGGKIKGTLRSENLMTRSAAGWKVKSMVQAGWGDKLTTSASADTH